MSQMSIDNYYMTADLFTFTVNPTSFDDAIVNNYGTYRIPYQRYHLFYGMGGIDPKTLILTGYFFGTNKMTDYASLVKHFTETYKIKKLFFQSDRFYLGVGQNIKMTQTGGRTNFTDYVATFQTFLGILLGATEKSSGTNAGNAVTYVTNIVGVYDGSGDVVITDGFGNTVTCLGANFSGKTYFKYNLVKLVDSGSGIYLTEWGHFEVSATLGGTYTRVPVSINPSIAVLKLDIGVNISTVTATNCTSYTVYYRDGWLV